MGHRWHQRAVEGPWWSVLSRLARVAAPPLLQVASDGQWENATVLPLGDGAPNVSAVLERIARSASADVAVEVLWPGQAFVGARWPAALWPQAALAVTRAHAAVRDHVSAQDAGLIAFVLVAMLDTEPATSVERVELGRVNAWISTRAEVLYRRGTPGRLLAPAAALAERPDLRTSPVPVAVEFAVTTPQPCWVGINVSVQEGLSHIVHEPTLRELVDAVGLAPRVADN